MRRAALRESSTPASLPAAEPVELQCCVLDYGRTFLGCKCFEGCLAARFWTNSAKAMQWLDNACFSDRALGNSWETFE
ncbi:hypothetical protein IAQ61_009145 [Plenodomus lingam]|uniref:uncharacterized protein n=1 Tax=Leptosphaeria maculans TaxID=5022 RepID=UPI00331950AF|nr:hypothetical protein IAQ61_009145 [Plenodomus lingam]